jgi:hypothetical protein
LEGFAACDVSGLVRTQRLASPLPVLHMDQDCGRSVGAELAVLLRHGWGRRAARALQQSAVRLPDLQLCIVEHAAHTALPPATKKVVLRLECTACKYRSHMALKRCKQ